MGAEPIAPHKDSSGGSRVWRNEQQARLTALLGWGEVIVAAVFAALSDPWDVRLFGTMLMLGAAGMTLKASRARLVVFEDRLVVHNVWRVRVIPWDDVLGFSVGIWWFVTARMAFVNLTDGSRLHIWGIQGPGRGNPLNRRAVAHDIVAKLNALARQDARTSLYLLIAIALIAFGAYCLHEGLIND